MCNRLKLSYPFRFSLYAYYSCYIYNRWLVVTGFEPTYARRAFPCYDEPMYKVVFNISVVKKKNQVALSNMPIRAIEYG